MIKITHLLENSKKGKYPLGAAMSTLPELEKELEKFMDENGYEAITDYNYEMTPVNPEGKRTVKVSCEAELRRL